MRSYLVVFSALFYNISCRGIISNGLAEVGKVVKFVDNFNPTSYFNSLLNIPNSLIKNITDSEVLYPPIKLEKPTKVRAPPAAEVKRHWYHAVGSYCTFEKLVFFKCDRGCVDYKIVKTFYNHFVGTKATIGVEPSTKEIIISHRGSHTLQNWIMDFNFKKARLPNSPEGVLVHEGFLDMYLSVASDINYYLMDMLNSGNYSGYKVVMTGQSLGGSLTTVHAVDIASKVKNKGFEIELYAYHSPRVGNQAFVDHAISLDFPIARYTNKADFISHLGLRSWGYVHIPVEFHTDFSDITSKSFRECSQDYDEDPNCGWKEINYISPISILNHGIGFGYPINRLC
jgi:hypothetical protein